MAMLTLLALTACGAVASNVAPANTQPSTGEQAALTNGTPQPPSEQMMPQSIRLALTMFKLDETDYPIDAAQAKTLLPLWKAARSLSNSDTVASQEVTALFKQIEAALTPEQASAIAELGLSMQDFGDLSQKLGLEFGGGRFGNMDPSLRETAQAMRESGGQMPGGGVFISPGGAGGPPPDMDGSGPGGGFDPAARQTAVAGGAANPGAAVGLNTQLLDAVISFLEAKTQ
jgi:hypothetical protein